jgi:hypothetical protein
VAAFVTRQGDAGSKVLVVAVVHIPDGTINYHHDGTVNLQVETSDIRLTDVKFGVGIGGEEIPCACISDTPYANVFPAGYKAELSVWTVNSDARPATFW